MGIAKDPSKKLKTERFVILLPHDTAEALKRLRNLCGHETLEETIGKALEMYCFTVTRDHEYREYIKKQEQGR